MQELPACFSDLSSLHSSKAQSQVSLKFCLSAGEFIPQSVHGEYELRMPWIVLNLLSQPGDVDVNSPCGRHGVVAPDFVQ